MRHFILLSGIVVFLFAQQIYVFSVEKNHVSGRVLPSLSQPTSDSLVLIVLVEKCNDCHASKKQTVFNRGNVANYYLAIEQQVLIKERMPKGKKNVLTPLEKTIIRQWVASKK